VLQPPIDFAPGWRLILVVVLSLFTAAGCSLGLALKRPRLAVAVPVPLTGVAALLQPESTAITTSAIAVGFVMMALATSYAADGSGERFEAAFEVRRIGRSLATGVALVVALVLASHLSFLFPSPDKHSTIPPRRPPASKPQHDVPLFKVQNPESTPLRLGVIDVYDVKEQTWMLPPYDSARLHRLHLPSALSAPPPQLKTFTATVTVEQATGHLLPDVAGAVRDDGRGTVDYDPRTQTLSLATRPVFTGLTYRLTATVPPTGAQLSDSKGVVPPAVKEFLTAPAVPPVVQDLLSKAPSGAYARLQYLRTALYKHFTAAGQGQPKDVSADRVVQFLGGGTGNPYELTASEALLARWAGVPSRIGYGYYGGTKLADGSEEIRPNNASTYLEVYLAPYGWVPILGTPPQAQASLSNNQRNTNPNIQAAPELGINVFLPVLSGNGLPLYAYVRYYLVRVLPVIVGLLLLIVAYPLPLKWLRRRRRREWAQAHGVPGRIAVAYAELRDTMIDLGLPTRHATPLELMEMVADDEEHEELAWLVTRGLWGDLRDSLDETDAVVGERLAGSVRSRLLKVQPETARLLAAVSRASLRQPFSRELPNVWRSIHPRDLIRSAKPALRRIRTTPAPAGAGALVVVLAMFLTGCGGPQQLHATAAAFPQRLAPSQIAGMTVQDEPKATATYLQGAKDKSVIVSSGKVLSMSTNGLIQAALQVAQLKPRFTSTNPEVVRAITKSIGKVTPLRPAGGHQLWSLDDGSQRIYLWFPTESAMALLVVRSQIPAGAAELLARALIGYADGAPVDEQALDAAFVSVLPVNSASPQAPVVAPPPPTVAPLPSPSDSSSSKGGGH
jgi:Transglutaminase-like superfamily